MSFDSLALDIRFEVAKALAREVGEVAKKRFLDRSSFTIGFKGPQDYLTEVDGEVERLIFSRLHQLFPEDGFIGEEGAGLPGHEGAPVWVVDPIDGTANFAHGVPHFCISIAAVVGSDIEIGVIYDPMVDELFATRRGAGATLNGVAMKISDIKDMKTATIEIGWNPRTGAEKFMSLLGRTVATGRVVFFDVTADWCLTCQANQRLVLDRPEVAQRLFGAADAVVAMRADWTRPNPEITGYLASFGRYGIPFNVIYGPAAPGGLVLPELLSVSAVLDGLTAAAGRPTPEARP